MGNEGKGEQKMAGIIECAAHKAGGVKWASVPPKKYKIILRH